MSSQTSFTSKLHPTPEKAKDLHAFFDYLENASNLFLDLGVSLLGGITPELTKDSKNQQLLCVVNWFRPMENTEENRNFEIKREELLNKFNDYYGENASDETKVYLESSIGEKYIWVDCRKKYQSMCQEFKLDFSNDLKTMLQEKILPLEKDMKTPWGSISSLFGDGTKEDRQTKTNILRSILFNVNEAIKNRLDKTIQQIILESVDAKSVKEFKEIYKINKDSGKNSGGRNPVIIEILHKPDASVDGKEAKSIIEYCNKTIKEKENSINWEHNLKLKDYINKKFPYNDAMWSESLKAALGVIQSKTTSNINFAIEKKQRENALNKDHEKYAIILNKFYENNNVQATVKPYNLGQNLEKLYKAWEKFDDVFEQDSVIEAIDEFCDSCEGKQPDKSLLKYLHSIRRELSSENAILGAKYNSNYEKYIRSKIHPLVPGKWSFTLSHNNSAISGGVLFPDPKYRTDRKDSIDAKIWIGIKFPESFYGREVVHHYPTFNARYLESIYLSGSNDETIEFRGSRFGYKTNYKNDQKINVKKKHVKCSKRINSIYNQFKNNALPKVEITKNGKYIKGSVVIARKNNQIYATICHKFSEKKSGISLNIGQRIMAVDQNAFALNSYCVYEITDSKDNHCIEIDGQKVYVKLIGDGEVKSEQLVGNVLVDQLSYQGTNNFESWKQEAENFVTTFDPNLLNDFKKNQHGNLQPWNKEYAYFLKKKILLQCKEKSLEVRSEIIRFITGKFGILRLGSLDRSSFDIIRHSLGMINSYYSYMIDSKCTIEDKIKFDKELYDLSQNIMQKRRKKRKSKVDLSASTIIKIAQHYSCKMIAIEKLNGKNDKSIMPSKAKNKNQNKLASDWSAIEIAKKLEEFAGMHGISLINIDPCYTSHQDPFEHTYENPKMKARFAQVPVDKISDFHLRNIKRFLKYKKPQGTQVYYQKATEDFLNHYKINHLKEELSKGTLSADSLKNALKEHQTVFIPQKGGRVYFSTHKSTKNANQIQFNQENLWQSNADGIATVNIMIKGIQKIIRINLKKES